MRRVLLWCAAGLVLAMPAVAAETKNTETKNDDPTTVRTKDQLRFNLPTDWPIELRGNGSAAGPVPIEQYLELKFKALETQLQVLDQRMNSLDLRLRVFEEREKSQSLKSTEQRSP